ncbi:MAG: fibronectin type III domain-containing protein [Clostridiales bacterium]|nr:fibronectin type III domain-containing protein [Candidatus Cacconaster stercorequi]
MRKRLCLLLIALVILVSSMPSVAFASQSRKSYFSKNYKLSGDGARDIVAVAMAQKGKTESKLHYTEGWCADFICDCAELAGVSDLIPRSGDCSGLKRETIACGAAHWNYKTSSTVKNVRMGDILVLNHGEHVALVESVGTTYIHCIEGNWSDKVSYVDRYKVNSRNNNWRQVITTVIRPDYSRLKAPDKPAITSVVNTADGITVKWNRVSDADCYRVYRRVGDGGWKLLKTVNTTSYTDQSQISNGKKYQYKIIACKTVGGTVYKSAYSDIKTIYRLTRPAISSVVNSATGKVTVKWANNTEATGYQVKYVTGTTTKTVYVKKGSAVSTVLSKLTKKSTYKVSVRAYKSVNNKNYYSAYSAVKSVKVIK